jgi:hypothetical protein
MVGGIGEDTEETRQAERRTPSPSPEPGNPAPATVSGSSGEEASPSDSQVRDTSVQRERLVFSNIEVSDRAVVASGAISDDVFEKESWEYAKLQEVGSEVQRKKRIIEEVIIEERRTEVQGKKGISD